MSMLDVNSVAGSAVPQNKSWSWLNTFPCSLSITSHPDHDWRVRLGHDARRDAEHRVQQRCISFLSVKTSELPQRNGRVLALSTSRF